MTGHTPQRENRHPADQQGVQGGDGRCMSSLGHLPEAVVEEKAAAGAVAPRRGAGEGELGARVAGWVAVVQMMTASSLKPRHYSAGWWVGREPPLAQKQAGRSASPRCGVRCPPSQLCGARKRCATARLVSARSTTGAVAPPAPDAATASGPDAVAWVWSVWYVCQGPLLLAPPVPLRTTYVGVWWMMGGWPAL